MSLTSGTTLGPYEILGPLGAGGNRSSRSQTAERDGERRRSVKIVDFGLAELKRLDEPDLSQAITQSAGTAEGVVLGTVGYMSPEQASGRNADHRSDQFPLGLIAYEAVTGRRPFGRATAVETMTGHPLE